MTSNHPTKVEAMPVGILRIIGRGAKAIVLLIGYVLTFCVLFVWHIFLGTGSNRSAKCSSRVDHNIEEKEIRRQQANDNEFWETINSQWWWQSTPNDKD